MFQTNCVYLEFNCRCHHCNYQADDIILKGSPIHKPYWLPWAPLPHLFFSNLTCIFCVFWQNYKKAINNECHE